MPCTLSFECLFVRWDFCRAFFYRYPIHWWLDDAVSRASGLRFTGGWFQCWLGTIV